MNNDNFNPEEYDYLPEQSLKVLQSSLEDLSAGLKALPIHISYVRKSEEDLPKKDFDYLGYWQQFKYFAVTEAEIKRRFIQNSSNYYPNAEAIILDNGIWCLDFDYDSATIYALWLAKQLEHDPDFLSKVYIERTLKGIHVWFLCPELVLTKDDRKLAMRPKEDGGFDVLIEVRIKHDCAVKAPSSVDASEIGMEDPCYIAESGDLKHLYSFPLEDGQAMIAAARSFDERPPQESKAVKKARQALYKTEKTKEYNGNGCDLSTPWGAADAVATIDDVCELFEDADWNYATEDSEGRIGYRYPGKMDGSISVNIIPPTDDTPVLIHPFTTSTGFEAGKNYTYSSAYAVLRCDGDFSEMARELYKQGYGPRHEPQAYQAPVIKVSPVAKAMATTRIARLAKDKDAWADIAYVIPTQTQHAAEFLTQLWLSIPTMENSVAVLAPFLLGFGIVSKEDAIKLLRALFGDAVTQTNEELEQELGLFDVPEESDFPVGYLLTHKLVGGLWFRMKHTGLVQADWSSLGVICDQDQVFTAIKHDEFIESPVWEQPTELFENRVGDMRNSDVSRLARYVNDKYLLNFGTQQIMTGIASATNHSSRRFHSIRKMLLGLPQWDRVERCDEFLQKYLLAEDTELNSLMFTRWLNGAIATAFCPGTSFPQMLILAGPQGIGKSLMYSALAMGYFSDSVTMNDMTNDQVLYEKAYGAWIVEAAEIAGFRKAGQAQLKRVISSTSAIFRTPYATKAERHLRNFVLCGSTNEKQFLLDVTGGRRFWVIECQQQFNKCPLWHELVKDPSFIQQLWAERLYKYNNGDNSLILPPEYLEEAAHRQYELLETPPLAPMVGRIVGECLKPCDAVISNGSITTTQPLWKNYPVRADVDELHAKIHGSDKVPDRPSKNAIIEALQFLGWNNKSGYDPALGKSVRGWYRPTEDETETAVLCKHEYYGEPKWFATKYLL